MPQARNPNFTEGGDNMPKENAAPVPELQERLIARRSLENELIDILGEANLREIGCQIAEIVRQHNLQKSPDVCRKLFSHLSDVIDGWNCV